MLSVVVGQQGPTLSRTTLSAWLRFNACAITSFKSTRWVLMRKAVLTATAAFALVCSGCLTLGAVADQAPAVRHSKNVRHVCQGPHCGPYAPCGARCRIVCPDGYSCFPLYGAYSPIGGVGYWGAYTLTGWGRW